MTNITPVSPSATSLENQVPQSMKLQTMSGVTEVTWDNTQPFTPVGQLVFFAQYLECSNLFKEWSDDAPLFYTSNNAPETRDVLGTLLLSVLSGHKRYVNMNQISGDKVSAEVLNLKKICSEDSARRGVKRMDEQDALLWLNNHLRKSWEPMTKRDWILDIDSTVKPVFGHQEDAKIGYNPVRPGRPSYSYHSYFIANTRIFLGVEVRSGNEHAGSFALPQLFQLIDSLDKESLPYLIRGDVSYGSDTMIKQCEERELNYLFKLKMSRKVKELARLTQSATVEWENAGKGWQGYKTTVRLHGWEQERNVLVMRRPVNKKQPKQVKEISNKEIQLELFPEIVDGNAGEWKYAVLVTNLNGSVLEVAQHYRDRGDCENTYDEAKNQWGWGGFTSQDVSSTRIMASIVALVANWWNVYTRLAIPDKHAEAITSRPLLLNAVGRFIKTGGQRFIRLCSSNSASDKVAETTQKVSRFLSTLTAQQLTPSQRWEAIIQRAFIAFDTPIAALPPPSEGIPQFD